MNIDRINKLVLSFLMIVAAWLVTGARPFWAMPLESADSRVLINLLGKAEVSNANITLGDVAQVDGMNDPLARIVKDVVLASSPDFGQKIVIGREDIRARLVNNRIDPVRVSLIGAVDVEVSREGRSVARSEITDLVEDYVRSCWPDDDVRLDIEYQRLPDNPTLPSDDLQLTILDPIRPRFSGAVSVSVVAVGDDGITEQRFPVSARVKTYEQVVVLRDDLPRSHVLSPDDVQYVERETTVSRGEPIKSVEELAGKRLRRQIRSGVVLTTDDIEFPPLIERGDEVTLIVEYKSIRIGCVGKAWQRGRKGDKILVRNQYGKNLTGTVEDAKTVIITDSPGDKK